MYLFDTNQIIYYFKNIEKVVEFFETIEMSDCEINLSVITKIELLSFEKRDEIDKIERLIVNSNILPLDNEVVDGTIEIRKKYKLKLPDAIIAATALVNNLILVSHNKKDFEKVDGLEVVDPLE